MSGVIPLSVALAGVAVAAVGALLLRGVRGYRVARILRSAPEIPLAEVPRRAAASDGRYVRVRGRIASDEEFPDEQDRPLVFRIRRLETAGRAGDWRTIDEERTGVPFGLQDRGVQVGLDIDALHEGLVVLARESTGRALEVRDRMPAEIPDDALVRYRIEQVSAVEHAVAAGVPSLTGDGRPILTAGMGRPLILSTLDIPDAMRVLSGDQRARVVAAAVMLAVGVVLLALGLGLWLVPRLVPA
jgi:hypothetical protein